MNTSFACFLMLEQVQGDMSKKSKVFRSVIFAHAAMIFVEGNIQHPMQLIFDAPMGANRAENAFGTGDTGNVITVFTTFVPPNPALSTDAGYRQQVLPVGKATQMLQDFGV